MGVPGNVKQSKEELVISSPYIGKHVYMMNWVQATILPGAVVLVLFLWHLRLYGTQGCAHTVPQPQDPCGRGPFPAHKGSTKLLLRVQSHVVVLGEEHGVCSDQPGLQCELTVLKKGQLCQSCELKSAGLCAQIPLPKSSISILAISGSLHAVTADGYGRAAEGHPSLSSLLTSLRGN